MSEDTKSTGGDPFRPYQGKYDSYPQLPKQGRSTDSICRDLKAMAEQEDANWKTGKISGTYYHAGDEHRAFMNRVFSLFSHVNVLQADLCPSMAKFESEIVSMTAQMLHADAAKQSDPSDVVAGAITCGGSESILMAMRVYREWGREEKGIREPEIIIPSTAHSAFWKAGDYYGIKVVKTPIGPDFRADPRAMESLITDKTVALVGSAGNYPYGLIDPLAELSDIAVKHGLGLHVDGCLGGFILPWIERLGYPVPPFDFRLRGVTSISADTHKFGFGPKGTSVILYRNKKLRRYQFFRLPDWQGGLYASPGAAGSRSGGLTAATWAVMVSLGEAGYLQGAASIMKVADEMLAGIKSIPELIVIGEPTFLISFRSDDVDIFHVNDYMKDHGWRLNALQLPPGLHFCVTMPQTLVPGIASRFTQDLRAATEYAKSKKGTPAQSSAIYGVAGTVDGNAVASELLVAYMEMLYDV
jgi:sphinganine-1-phosphate aldolase